MTPEHPSGHFAGHAPGHPPGHAPSGTAGGDTSTPRGPGHPSGHTPPGTDDPVSLCLGGRIAPPVMLARMVLAGADVATVRRTLASRPEAAGLLAFFEAHAASIGRMHAMLARVDHASATDTTRIAAQFDAAVAAAPEASVAAYSLGDPGLLALATTEVVTWLGRERLFAPGMDVLDLGCGFGRIAAALAAKGREAVGSSEGNSVGTSARGAEGDSGGGAGQGSVRAGSVLGLDVSPRMIEEARRRHGHLAGLRFAVSDGGGLGGLPEAAFDLVLAVDSFPYLFQAGVAEAHVTGAARVLRPGGTLVIVNLSYAPDPATDIRQAAGWAAAAGLRMEQDGVCPFTSWDGMAFVFRLARTHLARTSGLSPEHDQRARTSPRA